MGKDKKRKDNGEDDKEKKKHKKHDDDSGDEKKVKADKKEKKEKDKDKKKEKKDKEGKESAKPEGGLMGKPVPVGAQMGTPTPVGATSESAALAPQAQKTAAELLGLKAAEPTPAKKKKLKAWQDDELEMESGDEDTAPTKLQTLSSVAAQSLGQGSTEAAKEAQELDSLDAFMVDNTKVQDKQRRVISERQGEGKAASGEGSSQGMGMSVMDSSRVKTITLEEIMGLTGGSASSSSSAKPQEVEATEEAKKDASKTSPPEVEASPGDGEAANEDEDDAFHAAFIAQMRKMREGKTQAQLDDDIKDGSDTGEEWDEDRTGREARRQMKREARWKAKDEKALARQKAREARKAEKAEKGEQDDDDEEEEESEDSQQAVEPVSAFDQMEKDVKPMTKKEKRRMRREQRLKETEAKELAKKKLEKMPTGMKQEERLESDPEASEDSEMEKPAESYFDLLKRYTTKKTLPVVDHSTIDYKTFTKNLYVQVKEISAMKEHEVEDFRRTNGEIHVRGKNCPRPIKSFLQCGLPSAILKILEKRECLNPFPIQMQVIPALMCGRDIIGVAQTGSGKTLAYLMPLVRHALLQLPTRGRDDGPIGFIVAPTRELALQIQRECNVFCKAANMISVCAFGGGPMGEQLSALKKGCEILVGTPGRLIDCLTTSNGKITNLRNVTFLVLDEADRMFDMGFEPQIGMFLQTTRPDKQVAMLSATLPTHVEALARQCLKKPIEITVGERNTAAVNVSQFVEVLDETQKFYRLLQLLGEWHDHGSVIIFVHQQKDVDEMFTELLKFGYPALALHGGQDQCDRDFTLQDFKDGVANILVATSVAARGLDCKKVILVVNFKVPDHLEDYIHRIGRTGRAGKPGFAFTFVQPDEGDRAQDMVDALRQCGQEVPEKLKRLTEEFQSQVNRGEAKKRRKWGGFGGKGFKYDNTERSRQQKDRLKAKKDSLIGEDNGSEDEEEVKDAWDDNKPLSAAAQKKEGKGEGKSKGKKDKEADAKPAAESTPKSTGEAAAQIAERLKKEEEDKAKALLGDAPADSPAADAPPQGTLSSPALQTPSSLAGAGASSSGKVIKKTDEDLDAEAQRKAEEVLKNMSEEQRAEKLPKLKAALKAKLVKENEKLAAATEKPGPPMPPPPQVEEDPLMKAITSVPLVIGAPVPVGGEDHSIVARSIAQLQDGVLNLSNVMAKEAQERAAELMSATTSARGPGVHVEELEINAYPEIARKRVTAREPLLQIEELTGAKLWVKGQHFASNAKLPEGARRLYVEITASTAMAAQKGKHEVHKMMEALAIRTLNIPGTSRAVMGTPGRYDPSVGK